MTIFDQSFFDELHASASDGRTRERLRTKHAAEGPHRFDADANSTNVACVILAVLSLFLATVTYESVTHPPISAAGAFLGP